MTHTDIETLFPDNTSGEITAQDIRLFASSILDEIIKLNSTNANIYVDSLDGYLKIKPNSLPTTDPNIDGVVWSDSGVLKISTLVI